MAPSTTFWFRKLKSEGVNKAAQSCKTSRLAAVLMVFGFIQIHFTLYIVLHLNGQCEYQRLSIDHLKLSNL